ncbi:MAG: protein kinase, partial [Candidatus Promineifilaceae bacterium]
MVDNAVSGRGYEIIEEIGAGGFGVVYRARQPSVGRNVAIKVVLPEISRDPLFIRRFEQEARLAARLEHPNIVPLYDYWQDEERAYLVMRWMQGGSL